MHVDLEYFVDSTSNYLRPEYLRLTTLFFKNSVVSRKYPGRKIPAKKFWPQNSGTKFWPQIWLQNSGHSNFEKALILTIQFYGFY